MVMLVVVDWRSRLPLATEVSLYLVPMCEPYWSDRAVATSHQRSQGFHLSQIDGGFSLDLLNKQHKQYKPCKVGWFRLANVGCITYHPIPLMCATWFTWLRWWFQRANWIRWNHCPSFFGAMDGWKLGVLRWLLQIFLEWIETQSQPPSVDQDVFRATKVWEAEGKASCLATRRGTRICVQMCAVYMPYSCRTGIKDLPDFVLSKGMSC